MKKLNYLLCLLLSVCLLSVGCSAGKKEFTEEPIDMAQLETMLQKKETFVLLAERDNCPFCNALNSYIEETKNEHPGIVIYTLDTTSYQLMREQEGDTTLISNTEDGKKFLSYFPFFLYTPAVYMIRDGEPIKVGVGFDGSNGSVSLWDVDSTIDWNTSVPMSLWSFFEEGQPSEQQKAEDQEDQEDQSSQEAAQETQPSAEEDSQTEEAQ